METASTLLDIWIAFGLTLIALAVVIKLIEKYGGRNG